jgi:hypothetical protein
MMAWMLTTRRSIEEVGRFQVARLGKRMVCFAEEQNAMEVYIDARSRGWTFPHQPPTGLGHGLGKKVEHLERVESSHFKRHCTSFGIGLGADLRELCRAGIFA